MTFGDEWGWGSPKDEARKVHDVFREAGAFHRHRELFHQREQRILSRRVYEGLSKLFQAKNLWGAA